MFNDMFIVSAFKFDHDELEYFIPEISISKLFPENDCDDIVKTVGFELIGEIVIIKSYGSATVTPDGRISDNGIEIVVDPVVNIFSKMLVDDGMLDQMEMDMHNQILEIFNYQKPDLLIYLETDPELAFERLKKRSRNGEINITLEYLKNLNQIY